MNKVASLFLAISKSHFQSFIDMHIGSHRLTDLKLSSHVGRNGFSDIGNIITVCYLYMEYLCLPCEEYLYSSHQGTG